MFFKQKKSDQFSPENKADVLQKLREKYRRANSEHGTRFFDLNKLEERIAFQRATRSDFQRFVLDEMQFYKTMEQKALEEQARRKRQEEADARMREIMEANDALIAHYPDTFFHPMATLECRRIVGAISNLFPEIDTELRYVFQGRKEWGELKFYVSDLERFLYKPPMRMTAFLAAYVAELQKWGEAGRDDADRKFLQTAAMCLMGLSNEIGKALPNLSEEDTRRASAVKTRVEAIVSDFRLTDWAQHGLALKRGKYSP
jgi:hypothetical protein